MGRHTETYAHAPPVCSVWPLTILPFFSVHQSQVFEAKSRFPTLAAAERARIECAERVRFMIISLPGKFMLLHI